MRYLLIALLFATAPALAQPYVLAGMGQGEATVSADPSEVDFFGWQIGVGYRFNRFLGAEAAFHYLKAAESSPLVANQLTDVESKSQTLSLSAVGEVPIGDKAAIVGKLGVAQVRHTLRRETIQGSPFASLSLAEATDTDTGRIVGLGVRWRALRFMVERIDGVDGIGLDRLRFASLQLTVPF